MKAGFGIPLALLSLLLAVSAGASVSNDQVQSQHVREADGTSGQNTNSGAGIKTGHIQNLAVTGAKIADGAVTDSKVSGTISASKISGTVGNADTVDGMHAAALAPVAHDHNVYQKKYANVIVVATSGGDFDNPAEALVSITDASENNPYLVKIMPGTYVGMISLQDYVDVEGSGANVTKITSESPGSGWRTLDADYFVQHAEVRDLTIVQTTDSDPLSDATAVRIASATLTFRRVNVVAASTHFSRGIWFYGAGTLKLIESSVITTSGGTSHGVSVESGDSLTMQNSSVQADAPVAYGLFMWSNSTANIANSDISGTTSGIHDGWGLNAYRVKDSRMAGGSHAIWARPTSTFLGSTAQMEGLVLPPDTYKCLSCYDSSFDPLP